MVQSPPDGTVLQPIIKRSLSPSTAISNSALKSPSFTDPPSPNPTHTSPGANAAPSYFFQSHGSSIANPIGGGGGGGNGNDKAGKDTSGLAHLPPPTPGILRNKTESTTIRERPHSPPILHEPLLRVASPTGSNSNRSDSGFSSDGFQSPPPALGSPVQSSSASTMTAKPALDSLVTSGVDINRATSPPSPHCHFAPLPKPEERPQSRRSSIVSGRVKPFIPRPPERSDTMSTQGDEEALSPGEYTPSLSPNAPHSFSHPSPSTSSAEHFSALSQRLSSSLTFAAPTARHPSSPSRPTSRRSSSSRRSRSPSPPGGLSLRNSTSSSDHYSHHHRDRATSAGSRTHSPNLSRRPSTDALSLHYIEGAGGGGPVNLSRQNSRAGSERGSGEDSSATTVIGGGGPLMMALGGGGSTGLRRPLSSERRSTFDVSTSTSTPSPPPPPPPSSSSTIASSTLPVQASASSSSSSSMLGLNNGSGMMLVDKDKEADLHRLVEKAQHGNLDAERAVSPALHAKREREREGSVGRARSAAAAPSSEGERQQVQVVEVGPRSENERDEMDELEEVEEEDEEEEADEAREDEDDEEEDDEGNGDSEEEEEEEEPDRSREEDDDDEEEEEPAEERKTSKGAAVEVVRWHRDDPPPAAALDSTPSIPEDAIAEQEAEEESAVESQVSSRRPSTAFATVQPAVSAH